jgi:hypothetical protein
MLGNGISHLSVMYINVREARKGKEWTRNRRKTNKAKHKTKNTTLKTKTMSNADPTN